MTFCVSWFTHKPCTSASGGIIRHLNSFDLQPTTPTQVQLSHLIFNLLTLLPSFPTGRQVFWDNINIKSLDLIVSI